MRNRLLLTLLLGAMSASLMAQTKEDYGVTSEVTGIIKNGDFTQGTPVASTLYVSDKQMPKGEEEDAVPTGIFGMQAVPEWTASTPSDNIYNAEREDKANGKAAGLFNYTAEGATKDDPGAIFLAPYDQEGVYVIAPSRPDYKATGYTLGYVVDTNNELQYTQSVTLLAGDYLIEIPYVKQAAHGNESIVKSYNGFIADDGTEYLSTLKAYESQGSDLIAFRLKESTTGKISIGYKANSNGYTNQPYLFIDYVKIYKLDGKYFDKIEIASLKETLMNLIEIGKQLDESTQVVESQRVYDDPNATIAQVNEAIEKQRAANAALVNDMSSTFLKNAHFNLDEPLPNDEGICTYNYDKDKNNVTNYGMLPLTGWTASNPTDPSRNNLNEDTKYDGRSSGVFSVGSNAFLGNTNFLPPTTMSDGSTEGKVMGFLTCWGLTAQYTQNASLPAGTYQLTLSYYNAKGIDGTVGGDGSTNDKSIAKNLIGFIENDGTEHLGTRTSFPVDKWTVEVITFTLDKQTSGKFSIGYTAKGTGSGNMPHFFTDGISLSYKGEIANPSLWALQAAVTAAGETAAQNFNADVKAALQAAIKAGEDLIEAESTDDEANKAAADAISDAVAAATESIEAYNRLEEFINGDLANASNKYENDDYFADFYLDLIELSEDLYGVLTSGSYTTEQIDAVIASFPQKIKEATKTAWDSLIKSGEVLDGEGIDISPLFDKLGFTYRESQLEKGDIPESDVWDYEGYLKTGYGTMEKWNAAPFVVSRTLSDLPDGTYTVTTKAFYRVASNKENYKYYEAGTLDNFGKAYVFAGSDKTELANIAQFVGSEKFTGWDAANGTAEDKSDATLFAPNQQVAAYNMFNDDTYTERVQRSASSIVAGDAGKLTFGVMADGTAESWESDNWFVWYTFSIHYNGTADTALQSALEALIKEADEFDTDNTNGWASDMLEEAINDAEVALEEATSKDDLNKAIAAIQAALEAAKANVEYVSTLNTKFEELETVNNVYGKTASAAAKAEYEAIKDKYDNDFEELNNDELKELIDRIVKNIDALRIPGGYEDASDDNPFDMTDAIVNPDFEDVADPTLTTPQAPTGWTYNTAATGDTKVHHTSADPDSNPAKYNFDGAHGNWVFNTWHGSALADGYYVKQTINSLPAGTYKLTAALYTPQAEGRAMSLIATAGKRVYDVKIPFSDPEEINNTGENAISKVCENIFILEEGEALEIKVLSQSYFRADDFHLEYYGTDSNKETTDIEAVEAASASAPAAIYTLSGTKVSTLQKGINIVRYADGKVQKVLVK